MKFNLSESHLKPSGVHYETTKIQGKPSLRVVKDSKIVEVDEPTFVKVDGPDFGNGIIEANVLSRLLPNAPEYARGFIGIAFRIVPGNTKFEAIYVRPINARVEDQKRRNSSTQYFSYPDHKFDRLRKEHPGVYESYSDMEMDSWISLQIVVEENRAKLFVNGAPQPSLVVNDLKHGANLLGGIGLWVDIGTEGYFSDLSVTYK